MTPNLSPTSTLAGSPEPSALDNTKTSGEKSGDLAASNAPSAPAAPVPWQGEGTEASPYIVKFLEGEAANPQNWKPRTKWLITGNAALSTLCVAFASSVYSGGLEDFLPYFFSGPDAASSGHVEVVTLGISLFVLGFALGPLLWAPFSEQFGRRAVFIPTYFLFALFHIPCALAKNIETLLICRFLAGFWGSAPLTNSGGIISDLFSASDRALAMSLFALAPFAGPVLGPIVGGFLGMNASWRWIFWLLTIFSFAMWALGALIPETYGPVLLRQRAAKLQKEDRTHVYRSMFDLHPSFAAPLPQKLKTAIIRPFALLFKEMIVLLFSIYAAFIYGILYLFFVAFPIFFQQTLGWNQGVGALPFISVGIGMVLAVVANAVDNKRYVRNLQAAGGSLPPEARLPLCMIGGAVLPIGLFIFAWTTKTSVHWIVPIIFCAPFGFGMVCIFLAMMSYLIDAYYILAASALAANAVVRSIFGAVFPLFGRQMFNGMGTNWALCLIAFVALALAPIPFVFYYYGARIRQNSTFAPGHKPAAPAAPAALPAPATASPSTLHRKLSRREEEAEEIANLDLALTESRRQERENERREGVLNAQAAEEAERREREERQ
ncbi:hypothetical protein JCM8547_000375 [Rhodosporidiobolus lusitaniae]